MLIVLVKRLLEMLLLIEHLRLRSLEILFGECWLVLGDLELLLDLEES